MAAAGTVPAGAAGIASVGSDTVPFADGAAAVGSTGRAAAMGKLADPVVSGIDAVEVALAGPAVVFVAVTFELFITAVPGAPPGIVCVTLGAVPAAAAGAVACSPSAPPLPPIALTVSVYGK